jgi:hypothetical protein
MGIWSQFLTNQDRVVYKWKHYFPIYEAHFARFVNRPLVMFEIGVFKGGSLQMWKKYLGPHAQIVGIDIDPSCGQYEEDQVAVRIGDQSDVDFLGSLVEELGQPDIVLDDGSHQMQHIKTSFECLYPRLQSTGVYFVEDLHTAYWPEYGGGLREPQTFIEFAKGLIDELNANWTRDQLAPTDFTRTTMSIHFYDSCAVFEKGRVLPRTEYQFGN